MSVEELVVEEVEPSPFIEGTNIQYAWDSTAIDRVKQCGRLHHLKSEGWRGKGQSVHLRFGHEYHRCLQDYEILRAEGFEHRDAMEDVIRALLFRIVDWNPEHKQKNRETLVRTVVWYLEKHKDDMAKTWIMADGKPAVEVTFSFELDFGPTDDQPYVLCGKLDRIVVFAGDLFVMDRKTTSWPLNPRYWGQFTPNNQMTLYTIAADALQSDAHVKGTIIDAIQIMQSETRCVRSITYRTQEQLTEWLDDLTYWLGVAQYYAHSNYWPMNDTACRMCRFRDICSKDPGVREKFLEGNFERGERWNPLVPR